MLPKPAFFQKALSARFASSGPFCSLRFACTILEEHLYQQFKNLIVCLTKKPPPSSQGKVGDGPNVMLVQAFHGTS